MIASAFAAHDFTYLNPFERLLRAILGIAILATSAVVFAPALALSLMLIIQSFRRATAAPTLGNS